LGYSDHHGGTERNAAHFPALETDVIGKGEEQAEDNKQQCNDYGIFPEYFFYRTLKEHAGKGCRDSAQDNAEGESGVRGKHVSPHEAGTEVGDQIHYVPMEIQAKGDQCSQMKGHIKGNPRSRPAEYPGDHEQMRRTADGQNLGKTLQCTENRGMDRIHRVNALLTHCKWGTIEQQTTKIKTKTMAECYSRFTIMKK
jgi:hypothetical protein